EGKDLKAAFLARAGIGGVIDIILPDDVWVNVPILEAFTRESPYFLLKENGKFFIERGGERVEVGVVPPPAFYEKKTSEGTPFAQIGTVHGGYLTITPVAACDFFPKYESCKFCSANFIMGPVGKKALSVREIVEVVHEAFEEGIAEFVQLSLGFLEGEGHGIASLEPYITAIKRNFDTILAIEAHPPGKDAWIDRTYAMGVDSIAYHLDIYNPEIFASICPGKARQIGRERYLDALQYAASVFPSGTVTSNLIVGLEPVESTIDGINHLTKMGVVPLLPIFKPLEGSDYSGHRIPDTEEIAPLFAHLYNAVKGNKISMNWSKHVSIFITPIEGRYFTGDQAKLELTLYNLYKSKIGGMATREIAKLRRRLKVREIEDSFDSSEL
ncbi:MAG: radical SAM protein, partial [Deltaproteobacteria bacterium]